MALGPALAVNDVITRLNLGHNNIREDAAVALVEGLATCLQLKSLDLSGNPIGRRGVEHIAVRRCRLTHHLDPVLKALGFNFLKVHSLSRHLFSSINLHPPTSR